MLAKVVHVASSFMVSCSFFLLSFLYFLYISGSLCQLIYSDGSEYVGEFWKDKRHGTGVMMYADGSKYEGEWKNDKRHGNGKLSTPDRKVEGFWENDKFVEKDE
eukprot:m.170527 g.170527  ORF g.170527 m.170527 type:complete len:104 (+) comp15339_c0_seq1:416-727(+)